MQIDFDKKLSAAKADAKIYLDEIVKAKDTELNEAKAEAKKHLDETIKNKDLEIRSAALQAAKDTKTLKENHSKAMKKAEDQFEIYLDKLRDALEKEKNKSATVDDRNKRLDSKSADLRKDEEEFTKKDVELKRAKAQLDMDRDVVARQIRTYEQADNAVAQLKQDLEAAKRKITELEAGNQNLSLLRSRPNITEEEVSNLKAANTNLYNGNLKLDAQLRDAVTAKKQSEADLGEKIKAGVKLAEEKDKLKEEIKNSKEKYETNIAEYITANDILALEKQELEEKLKEVQAPAAPKPPPAGEESPAKQKSRKPAVPNFGGQKTKNKGDVSKSAEVTPIKKPNDGVQSSGEKRALTRPPAPPTEEETNTEPDPKKTKTDSNSEPKPKTTENI